jgi:hypothetical protein
LPHRTPNLEPWAAGKTECAGWKPGEGWKFNQALGISDWRAAFIRSSFSSRSRLISCVRASSFPGSCSFAACAQSSCQRSFISSCMSLRLTFLTPFSLWTVVAKREQVGASGQGYSLGLPVSYVQVSRGLKPCKSHQYIGERVLSEEFGVNRKNSGQKCLEAASPNPVGNSHQRDGDEDVRPNPHYPLKDGHASILARAVRLCLLIFGSYSPVRGGRGNASGQELEAQRLTARLVRNPSHRGDPELPCALGYSRVRGSAMGRGACVRECGEERTGGCYAS